MSRVAGYTPPWLSRPSPGFDFFNKNQIASSDPQNAQGQVSSSCVPSRTVACWHTQVFTVVGNELRWSDLILLKEQWELQQDRWRRRSSSKNNPEFVSHGTVYDENDETLLDTHYKVLKVPVSRQIQQILIDPKGNHMAIITSHTVHVAVLPDPSHLTAADTPEIKLKTFQLGPTVHVVERSQVASVLWHPLGGQHPALVTVTADSVVRLWELDRRNRWSFDSPSLAFDLKKLADGRSSAEDFSPSKYGTGKGFSPDSFEMEVAAVCFGARRHEDPPLATMTLWVAMKEGDIYALCPFLPSKWDPAEPFAKNLSSSIRCQAASFSDSNKADARQRKLKEQQLSWLVEIEKQASASSNQRPSNLSPIPQLQGPFRLAPDPDLMFNITDIYVNNPASDAISETESTSDAEELEYLPSIEFLCIATTDGVVHICTNLDPIEPKWLPAKMSSLLREDDRTERDPELLIVESVSLFRNARACWPLITPASNSLGAFFVTHHGGVSCIDTSPLANALLRELNHGPATGSEFRIGMLLDDSRASIYQPITVSNRLGDSSASNTQPTTCVSILDSDLGYFLLTVVAGQPYAATLTSEDPHILLHGATSPDVEEAEIEGLVSSESRPSYQPPEEFWMESALQSFMDQHVHVRNRRFMSEEIRLSPVTLNLLMEAHRVLSYQTHRLGVAAGDLFSRCERLLSEFRDHVERTREASIRVNNVLDADNDPYNDTNAQNIEQRLENARERQQDLEGRYDKLRRNLSTMSSRPLSGKEQEWMAEIQAMDNLITSSRSEYDDVRSGTNIANPSNPTTRLDELKLLKARVISDTQELTGHLNRPTQGLGENEYEEVDGPWATWDLLNVKPGKIKARFEEIQEKMDRQTAQVQATSSKLEKLKHIAI